MYQRSADFHLILKALSHTNYILKNELPLKDSGRLELAQQEFSRALAYHLGKKPS